MARHRIFDASFSELPIPCHEIDIDGTITYVNSAECALLGLTEDEIIGRPVWDFVEPDEWRTSREAVRLKLAGKQPLKCFERGYIRPDGTHLTVEIYESHIHDDRNEIIGIRSFLIDITQRKRAEQALSKSESRYRHLVDYASDIIYQADLQGRFTIVNPVATKLLGYSEDELVGRKYLTLIRPDFRQKVQRFYREQLTKRLAHTYLEFPALARDGAELWFGQNVELIEEEGRPVGFQAITRDITQQHHDMEARIQHRQRLESLGVLAGGIAHDFNNLLAAVMGYAGLASAELPEGSRARANIEEVISAAHSAAELTQQMLAYSGRGRFVTEPVNLSHLIADVSRLVSTLVSKKASLRLALAPDLPSIIGDTAQIRQILINLLTNASDALGDDPGSIEVVTGTITAAERELPGSGPGVFLPGGRYVFVEVADTGCGMDPATQEKIFDPFFTTKFMGRGLGLAAVLGIVQGHNGALIVSSEPGRGSRFRVLFPAADEPARRSDTQKEVSPTGWGAEGTVLVVDDEPAIRELARQILENAGLTVLEARDGKEAVKRFEEHIDEVRAIVLDLTMPGMDGGEVFRHVRRLRPGVKVVLCSGYNMEEVSGKFRTDASARFLRKPYLPSELIDTIRAVMESDK